MLRKPAAKELPEILLDLLANDEDELAEAGPLRVKDRVVQHRLAARVASSGELFPFLRLLRLFAAYFTGNCWR
jgi:hypothetical protein